MAVTKLADYQISSVTSDMREDGLYEGTTSPSPSDVNIGQLLDAQCHRYRERVAAVSRWQGKRVTYQTLYTTCRDIAQSLLIHGVRPGDHVVVLAGNTIEYVQLFFAVGAIGAIFAIINPTFTTEEVIAVVEFLGKTPAPHISLIHLR